MSIQTIPIKKRVFVVLLLEAVVGALFVKPVLHVEMRSGSSVSEALAFYIIEWAFTAAWFLSDAIDRESL
jgi:hypothetical protein